MTFDSKLTFEKHLRLVSRAASQRPGILRKSWRVFHDRLLIGRCFWGFVLPVLEYCSAVWCSAANTHLKLLDRVVSGACFLADGVLNCNLSHRWSVAVLCMLYKIRCNQMHPLCGALPVSYVPVRVTRGALIAHRYTCAPPRCRTSQYRRIFILLLNISLERSGWPRIRRCGIDGFQEQVQCLFVGLVALSFPVFNCFPFLFFSSIGWLCGAGVFGLIGCQSPSPVLASPIFFDNNDNNQLWSCITINYTAVYYYSLIQS